MELSLYFYTLAISLLFTVGVFSIWNTASLASTLDCPSRLNEGRLSPCMGASRGVLILVRVGEAHVMPECVVENSSSDPLRPDIVGEP